MDLFTGNLLLAPTSLVQLSQQQIFCFSSSKGSHEKCPGNAPFSVTAPSVKLARLCQKLGEGSERTAKWGRRKGALHALLKVKAYTPQK